MPALTDQPGINLKGSFHLQRYRHLIQLVDTMNCGLLVRDADDRIRFANRQIMEWLSYSRSEVVGRRVEEFAPPELHDQIREELEALKKGDLRIRMIVLQRRDSSTFPVLTIPHQFYDTRGRPAGGFGIIVDLGAVQTAKPVGTPSRDELGNSLHRIALELESLGLSAGARLSASPSLHHPDLGSLSPREKEVLVYLLAGERVPSIANQLYISPHTVRNHLKSMYRKLGVHTQAQLIQRVRSL